MLLLQEQNVPQRISAFIVVTERNVPLGVKIGDQDSLSAIGKVAGEVRDGGGLANAAFLIGDCDYFHIPSFSVEDPPGG